MGGAKYTPRGNRTARETWSAYAKPKSISVSNAEHNEHQGIKEGEYIPKQEKTNKERSKNIIIVDLKRKS